MVRTVLPDNDMWRGKALITELCLALIGGRACCWGGWILACGGLRPLAGQWLVKSGADSGTLKKKEKKRGGGGLAFAPPPRPPAPKSAPGFQPILENIMLQGLSGRPAIISWTRHVKKNWGKINQFRSVYFLNRLPHINILTEGVQHHNNGA